MPPVGPPPKLTMGARAWRRNAGLVERDGTTRDGGTWAKCARTVRQRRAPPVFMGHMYFGEPSVTELTDSRHYIKSLGSGIHAALLTNG
jgi:hypothetical protein